MDIILFSKGKARERKWKSIIIQWKEMGKAVRQVLHNRSTGNAMMERRERIAYLNLSFQMKGVRENHFNSSLSFSPLLSFPPPSFFLPVILNYSINVHSFLLMDCSFSMTSHGFDNVNTYHTCCIGISRTSQWLFYYLFVCLFLSFIRSQVSWLVQKLEFHKHNPHST